MKRNILFLAVLLSVCSALGQTAAQGIIPRPVSMVAGEGEFLFGDGTVLCVENDELKPLGDYIRGYIRPLCDGDGMMGFIRRHTGRKTLTLTLAEGLKPEGYRLRVDSRGVLVEGADYGGVFNGLQTLLQLLPAEVYGGGLDVERVSIPAVQIEDWPRFAYRGMMLDIARTFSDKQRVERFIDNMSHHKINKLHWHLTDDEGWRVEIMSHPELAATGGFRGGDSPVPPAYGEWENRYGGYLTQQEVKEIVAYAAVRNVEIIPEVDLPGHSRAAARVMPGILCGDATRSGLRNDRRNVWCASKESNYRLLDEILGELCAIFPSHHFHIGGDEVVMDQWLKCPECSKLARRDGKTDGHFVEDHFLGRVAEILARHGKKAAVWNEAVNGGGLSRESRVHAWKQDVAVSRNVAAKGFETIVMPSSYFYFDMKQSPEEEGLTWAGVVDTKRNYSFRFAEQGFTPAMMANVEGVEGAFWSECYLSHDADYLDYQTYPRICSLAEVAWTPDERRSWDDFYARLCVSHLDRLEGMGVKFRMFPPEVKYVSGAAVATAPCEGCRIRYTVDGSEPTVESALYTGPVPTDRPALCRFSAERSGVSSPSVPAAKPRRLTPRFRLSSSMKAQEKTPFANAEGYRTFARTTRPPVAGDWVEFRFEAPVMCSTMEFITGFTFLPRYPIAAGVAEVSYDGEHFEKAGTLTQGRITLRPTRPVRAVRLVSTMDGNGETAVLINPPLLLKYH